MAGIGLQMLVGVLLGLWAGRWVDNHFGWTPWGMLACVALGLASGFYTLIREGMRVNRDDGSSQRKPNGKER